MALSGTLRTLSLAEIFQTLARSAATGVLKLVSGTNSLDVTFNDGNIIDVLDTTPGAQHTLIQRLEAAGVLVAEVSASDEDAGRNSGGYQAISSLIRKGTVDDDTVAETIQGQMYDQLFDLFTWEDADFIFIEAIAEEADVVRMVEEAVQRNLNISTNMVLMESARRLDEWDYAKKSISDRHAVIQLTHPEDPFIIESQNVYPDRAIISLIDGTRSIVEVVNDSVATRLDVYTCISHLLERQLIIFRGSDTVIREAINFDQNHQYAEAARLYRHAIRKTPERSDVIERLAALLEHLGDTEEAARSYGSLALGQINHGNNQQAIEYAKRAVKLAGPNGMEQRQVYLKCLRSAELLGEYKQEAYAFISDLTQIGRFKEAQNEAKEVLTVEPNDDNARHLLATAFLANSDNVCEENEIVCIECGEINARSSANCRNCRADLTINCSACMRSIAISDVVCSYCGEDPHKLRDDNLEEQATIITSVYREDEFKKQIEEANEYRRQGEFDKALAIWKHIAHSKHNDPQILQHVRDLEIMSHEQAIEQYIMRANTHRQNRRYMRAARFYKSALNSVHARDPRAHRLKVLYTTTKQAHRRTSLLYGIAGFVLAVAAFIVFNQMRLEKAFTDEVNLAILDLENKSEQTGSVELYQSVLQVKADLTQRSLEFGEIGSLKLQTIETLVNGIRIKSAEDELKRLENLVANKNTTEARKRFQTYQVSFANFSSARSSRILSEINSLEEEQNLLSQQKELDPERLKSAQDLLKQNKKEDALQILNTLLMSPEKKVAQTAQDLTKRLESEREQFYKRYSFAEEISLQSLPEGLKRSQELVLDAPSWNKNVELEQRISSLTTRMTKASKDFVEVRSNKQIAELKEFIRNYPGTEESLVAAKIQKRLEGEEKTRDTLLQRIQAAREGEDWENLHSLIRSFKRGYPDFDHAVLALPLQINCIQKDATIRIGDQIINHPMYLYFHQSKPVSITINAKGFEELSISSDALVNQWSWQPVLTRSILWKYAGSRDTYVMSPQKDALILFSDSRIAAIAYDNGQTLYQHDIQSSAMLEDPLAWIKNAGALNSQSVFVAPDLSTLYQVSEAGSQIIAQFSSNISGPVQVYNNILFGDAQRYLLGADKIYYGSDLLSLSEIDLNSPLQAGPIVQDANGAQVFTAATEDGRLVLYSEENKSLIHESFIAAGHVNCLISLDKQNFIALLDGSRIQAYRIDGDSPVPSWDYSFKHAPLGLPQFDGRHIIQSTEHGVIALARNGRVAYSIEVKEKVVAATGNPSYAIIADAQGKVRAYAHNPSKELWQRNFKEKIQSVAIHQNSAYIALEGGAIYAFALKE